MESLVVREFRVEGRRQQLPLAGVDDRAVAQPDFCSSVSHIVGDVLDNAAFTQVSRARA